jgi:hypothetical protein
MRASNSIVAIADRLGTVSLYYRAFAPERNNMPHISRWFWGKNPGRCSRHRAAGVRSD